MNRQNLTATIAACVVAATLIGCEREGTDTGDAAAPADPVDPVASADMGTPAEGAYASAAGIVTVADIAGNPSAYSGRTVTVEADVEEVLSPFAFSLDEDSPTTGGIDNDLLVFSRKAANLTEIDDQWLNNRVRVTGVVHTAGIVELEREIGWDLDSEIEAEVEQREPVLMATSVERIPGG